jgi:FKBP-type peptidyl-prolyl cis-trans isomerase FkpA
MPRMTRALIILAILVAIALVLVFTLGRGGGGTAAGQPLCENIPAAPTQADVEGATSLQATDQVVGSGDEAKAGQSVTVHYYGRLADGTKFDSSCDRDQPFTFQLGAGQVIQGWDQGVAGMKVGGKRRLIIPANLAYGPSGAGGVIPPNANLVFDVELISVD